MVTAATKLRHLPLERKAMANLDSILKSRHITFSTKVCLVKAMIFPVVMYGCDSWTIKKAKHWRIDAFELWCWKRPLWVLWTARRSNQSILKETNPEYSLEGLMLKLKIQYFGHLMRRTDSLEKTLVLGKTEGGEGGNRGRDGWMVSLTQRIRVWASPGRRWRTGKPGMLQSMGSQSIRHNWATEPQEIHIYGLPQCLSSKESTCNAGDSGGAGTIPSWGSSSGGRKWQLTPIFLCENPHGQRSLVGYNPKDHRVRHTEQTHAPKNRAQNTWNKNYPLPNNGQNK